MKSSIWFLPLATCTLLMTGCEDNGNDTIDQGYLRGIYIVNEGAFMSNNGSISYFDQGAGTITNGIFEAANGRPLGDVVQSMEVVNDTVGYIVVNGSAKVEIVGLTAFKTITAPVPVPYPRYFIQAGENKGYLSSGSMQGHLYVFDLNAHTIVDSVAVGYGPERMVALGNHVYVANSGGWGLDSTISVVDIVSDEVVASLKTGEVPADIALDGNEDLWVYCKGFASYNWEPPYDLISESDALLQKIDPVTGNMLWQGFVGKAGDYTTSLPKMSLSADKASLYYLRPDGVYKIDVDAPAIPAFPIIEGSYYGIGINPSDGYIYLFESGFSGNGTMKVHDEEGNKVAEGTVGIAPNGAVFH